ncbi:MAG TPA: hypothetical protein VGF67_13495 [Ktedonobacteraceae bacterium]
MDQRVFLVRSLQGLPAAVIPPCRPLTLVACEHFFWLSCNGVGVET